MNRPLDARAWLLWLAGMLIPALFTFNLWIQLLTIGIALLVWPGDATDGQGGFLQRGVLLRLAVAAMVIGALFNVLAVRQGATVLLTLPDALPLLGGPLTLEALSYGLLNALRVVSIVFAFATFSRVIDYADLLRLMPAALFELGLMVSIGVTLIPFTLRAFREIREAQALRGHQAQGVRGLLPLFAPLVANGMEHALMLAESLEARGYGAARLSRRVAAGQLMALFSLVVLLLLLVLHTFSPLSDGVMVAGLLGTVALMLVGFRQLASGSGRTRWRRLRWGLPEVVVTAGVIAATAGVLVADRTLLSYDPYRLTALGWPAFSPWLGLALLGLALPALFTPEVAARGVEHEVTASSAALSD
jgi:energy-coupling factor transport system permease protein